MDYVMGKLLDNYFESVANSDEARDILNYTLTYSFWRKCPVPQPGENAQKFCWRYVRRFILYKKVIIIADFLSTLTRATRTMLEDIVSLLVDDDVVFNVVCPPPGTHVGYLMSQVICGPLMQAYLDQAHGAVNHIPNLQYVDNNYKLLSAAFMGFRFKPKQWSYYFKLADVPYGPHVVPITDDVVGIHPACDPQLFDRLQSRLRPLTINTVMRKKDPVELYDFFYEKINEFLNVDRNHWFDTFLSLFVNQFVKTRNVTPLNRRHMGNERDALCAASFECPFEVLMKSSSLPKEIWPVAGSIIGVKSNIHGSSYYGIEVTLQKKNPKRKRDEDASYVSYYF